MCVALWLSRPAERPVRELFVAQVDDLAVRAHGLGRLLEREQKLLPALGETVEVSCRVLPGEELERADALPEGGLPELLRLARAEEALVREGLAQRDLRQRRGALLLHSVGAALRALGEGQRVVAHAADRNASPRLLRERQQIAVEPELACEAQRDADRAGVGRQDADRVLIERDLSAAAPLRRLIFALAEHELRLLDEKRVEAPLPEELRQLLAEAVEGEAEHGDLDLLAGERVEPDPVVDRAEGLELRVVEEAAAEPQPLFFENDLRLAAGDLSAVLHQSLPPQLPQNFMPGSFSKPQLGHLPLFCMGEPHSPQNFRPRATCAPQLGQRCVPSGAPQ